MLHPNEITEAGVRGSFFSEASAETSQRTFHLNCVSGNFEFNGSEGGRWGWGGEGKDEDIPDSSLSKQRNHKTA